MSITVLHIIKRFDDFVAPDDVSVDVARGSLTALLGPSSAVNDPGFTSTETSSSATKSSKRFVMRLTEIDISTGTPSVGGRSWR